MGKTLRIGPNLIQKGGTYYTDFRISVWDSKIGEYRPSRINRSLGTDKELAMIRLGKMLARKKNHRNGEVDTTWNGFKARVEEMSRTSPKSTRMAYNRALRNIEASCNPQQVSHFTPGVLEALQVKWQNNRRGKYIIVKDVKTIKALMRKAEVWGFCDRRDWKEIKTKKLPRGRVDYHPLEELQALLNQTSGYWRTAVFLGGRAGLRPAEAYHLEKRDVDLDRRLICIGPKKDWVPKDYEAREIPIPDDLYDYLKALLPTLQGRHVVSWPETGERPSYNSYLALARKVLKAQINGKPFRSYLYKLRHSYGAAFVQSGGRIEDLQDLMGHDNINTTRIYAHLAPHSAREAVNNMPRLSVEYDLEYTSTERVSPTGIYEGEGDRRTKPLFPVPTTVNSKVAEIEFCPLPCKRGG